MPIMFKMILLFVSLSYARDKSIIQGTQDNTPSNWAITNALVFTEPGVFIKDCSILMRNGRIEKVGRYIRIPRDAYRVDLEGATVYAGFIDSWVENKNKSPRGKESQYNPNISPEYDPASNIEISKKHLKSLRKNGFTTAHVVPENGIIQGGSSIILLGDSQKQISSNVAQVISFNERNKEYKGYPKSQLGSIALIRQTIIDSKWYKKGLDIYANNQDENIPPLINKSLESLNYFIKNKLPFLFISNNETESFRALEIAKEFNFRPWIYGNGFEYRRLDYFDKQKPSFILNLNYPKIPNISIPNEALQYSTRDLKHWEKAPENLIKVHNKSLTFSLTSSDLDKGQSFRSNLAKSIKLGLPKDVALSSLTTNPALEMGIDKSLGKIAPGYIANLVVVDGDYFDIKSRVISVWVEGKEFPISPRYKVKYEGLWNIKFNGTSYPIEFLKKNSKAHKKPIYAEIIYKNKKIAIDNIEIYGSKLQFTLDGTDIDEKGILSFKGDYQKDQIKGQIYNSLNQEFLFQADRSKIKKKEKTMLPKKSETILTYPEGSYGFEFIPEKPNAILINNATIWTSGPKGLLYEWDILFVDGLIDQIAPDISIPKGSAVVIEGEGKHITPGIIDCHSHIAAYAINEGTNSITSEVRIKDVINPNDIYIYKQLSGGVTTTNILHGSANPIGGQNAVLKLRWGKNPKELIFQEAPEGIKFALGENVKRANWSNDNRYPRTRMGVEQIIRDAFRAAIDYKNIKKTFSRNAKLQRIKIPPKINLKLEALVEVLEGKRLVHAHSYRQDEIIMLIRLAEEFNFKIATFQHVLEGYKVADLIAEHGAGASTFSDWWQYKYEVIDAIPHNGPIMTKNDVIVSYNSDDQELARSLNVEASKAIKYGNLTEEEALKYITINPARQLNIETWVGSIEIGKQADFVVWDGPPLSSSSHVLQTWIDGYKYYDYLDNKELEERDTEIRSTIIQSILKIKNAKKNKK